MSKINLYMLDKKLDELLKTTKEEGIISRLNSFRPIDYREYIKEDLDNLTPLWKHNGTYYKNLKDIYEVAVLNGYDKEKRTFKNLLDDYDRQNELWIYNIQLIFASFIERLNYYYTCDGNFLTKNLLSILKGNPYNSRIILRIDGENITINRAIISYSHFIGEIEGDEELLMFIDGFYGNCGVDNLILKDKKKKDEVKW